MKSLNLNALLTVRRTVTLDGIEHRVRPMRSRVAYIIDAATSTESTVDKLRLYGDAVAAIVPTLTQDAIDDLTQEQIAAIIECASVEIRAVEEAAADPNVSSSAPAQTTELSDSVAT